MIRGLYTAVSGMIVGETKQAIITNNIANANTVGFKSDNLNVKNFGDVMIYNYDKIIGSRNVKNNIGSISTGSGIESVSTFFTQGVVQNTNRETDFAIQGRGFFTLSRDGQEYYSRDGHFNVNLEGNLVNDMGDVVQGYDLYTGMMGPIKVGQGTISCSSEGNISVDGVERYKIAISDFENYDGLKKVGDNLYEGTGARRAMNYSISHKYIEKSNVNIVKETVEMMNNTRAFESNQKVVQVIDETLGKAVNEVGKL